MPELSSKSDSNKPIPQAHRAAIVLCGGKSSRMGVPKATLPFGPELMLQRMVRLVSEIVPTVVVVKAAEQPLPELPPSVLIAVDRAEGRGPLEGLAAGLAALPDQAEAAFVTSCDAPLLAPKLIARLFELLGEKEAAVPREDKFYQPLTAVYRRRILPQVEQLLASDQRKPGMLFELLPSRVIPQDELRGVDPELLSFQNLNRPEDYLAALARAGFEPEPAVLELFKRT